MPTTSLDVLDAKLNTLANPARLERFVLRFVAPEEHDLARKRMASPVMRLAGAAVTELVRRRLDVPHVDDSTDDALRALVRRAIDAGVLPARPADWPADVFLCLYPRICAQVIAVSNGYALPEVAARIVQDAVAGHENWCEWVYSCYGRDARRCVREALSGRRRRCERKSVGFSGLRRGEQAVAKALLGMEMQFASWF
ncbi:MAG: hypothetical protein IT574_03015 [Candidatus Aureabacteria bacterium]|nr:hypothetical protein [Candidatus Auribacterota bacterium]